MHRDPHGSLVHRLGAVAGGAAIVAALLLGATVPTAAGAVVDPHKVVATLQPGQLADDDPGASGTVELTLDRAGGQACFVIAVALTDLAGDPPTLIDVHDQTTGSPGDVVLTLTMSVDGTGAASGCVPADPTLIDAILAAPINYAALVTTAGFPNGAVLGTFAWSYPSTGLDVMTLICGPSIQSPAQVPPPGGDVCRTIVLPKDDLAPSLPPGYTIHGYGGTKVFDYHVNDGLNVDASIAKAERSGGGTCDSTTKSCQMGFLPYEWNPIGQGPTTIAPTVLPAGYRFGTAIATDAIDPNHVLPFSIDSQHTMTVDSTGTQLVSVVVYLFSSADTSKPTVTTPTLSYAPGQAVSSFLPVRLAWTGHDTGSGIDRYQVQVRRDSGSWTTVAGLHVPAIVVHISTGHLYRFRVRAIDIAGNIGPWAYSATERASVTQDSSGAVTYSGTWHVRHLSSALGGTLHDSTAAGSRASLTFFGRAVAWVAPRGMTRGSARVYVDGTLAATVDLHAAASSRLVVFSRRWASDGTHTIAIKVVGTAGHPGVGLDAFLLLR